MNNPHIPSASSTSSVDCFKRTNSKTVITTFSYFIRSFIKQNIRNIDPMVSNSQMTAYINDITNIQNIFSDISIYFIVIEYCFALKTQSTNPSISLLEQSIHNILFIQEKIMEIKTILPNITEKLLNDYMNDITLLQEMGPENKIESYFQNYVYLIIHLGFIYSKTTEYLIVHDTMAQIRIKKPNSTDSEMKQYINDIIYLQKTNVDMGISEIVDTFLSDL